MLLTLSHEATVNLKKITEVLLEGSEKALLTLAEKEVCLQTVDATWTCTAIYRIPRSQYSLSRFSQCPPVSIKFDLKTLHAFLKSGGTRVLAFRYNANGQVKLISACGPNIRGTRARQKAPVQLIEIKDRCPYVAIPKTVFHNWLNVKLDPHEFSNITLDLATGGGYMEMSVYGNNMVVFQSVFDVGNVHFQTHDFPVQQNRHCRPARSAQKRRLGQQCQNSDVLVKERFIIKFLKLVCGLASICAHMGIYLKPQNPLFMELLFPCKASLTMCLIPSTQEKRNQNGQQC